MKTIEPLLRELATKLGTTVEYLWATLMRQARVQAIVDGAFLAFYCLFIIAVIEFSRWASKKDKNDCTWFDRHDDGTIVFGITSVLAGLIFAIAALFIVSEFITCLVNPQYWALKEVLRAVGK